MDEFNFTYNILIFSFAFLALGFALENDIRKNNGVKIGQVFIFIFLAAALFMFGFREVSVGTDTDMYYWQYKNYKGIELGTDFLMYYIFATLNNFSRNPTLFFVFIAILYISTFGIALIKYAKTVGSSPLLVLFSFVSFFFFQTMGINIIRQGVSLGFFILGLSYYLADSKSLAKKQVIIPLILAIGFHFTAIIPIVFFGIAVYFKKLKFWFFVALYASTAILSAFNVSILALKNIVNLSLLDKRRSTYLDTSDFSDLYSIGFKPQFVVFNTIFLVLFFCIKKFVYTSKEYDYMLKYYLLTSSLFFMVFQLPYSDRWGIMSWVIIPFMLAPVFRGSNKIKLATLTVLFLTFIFIFFQIILVK